MTQSTFPYRLGLDVGTNSIGWFMIRLNDQDNPIGLGPGGVRIFPDGRDPQSKTSNAVSRRVARGMRRRRDRYLQRRRHLLMALVKYGLIPAEETARKALESLDPYELRASALTGVLPLYHVGRAIFHLNQRRGFKSNRKTDGASDDKGAIKIGETRLKAAMADADAHSIGAFFAKRHAERRTVRARNISGGAKAEYEFYPTRDLLEAEFHKIWMEQAAHHAALNDEAKTEIHEIIFFQSELKAPQVGKCSLSPAENRDDLDGFRCSWAHPLAQRFRIWQEVRNLAIIETGQEAKALSKEQGDKVALALFQNGKYSFDKIRALLKLHQEARFNLESDKRDHLLGDETADRLSHKSRFGKTWRGLPLERQILIVDRLFDEADEGVLIAWLVAECGLDEAAAERVADVPLPDGHSRYGLRAIRKMVPAMVNGMTKTEAELLVNPNAHQPTGEIMDRLPYYGAWLQDDVVGSGDPRDPDEKRWGKVPNPTVHIGLGQLRRIVNLLVERYGPPKQVVVELARELKLSPKQLDRIEREQKKNQDKNDERRKQLGQLGLPDSAGNLLRLRLWEEANPDDPLDRRCPYTGEQISVHRLFSAEIDIDHLIPFSDSWDDSAANKVVCLREANRKKGNRTPFEAFGHSAEWPDIAARANAFPNNKRWRFAPDARDRFEREGGFQARQLNETGWFARMAKDYLAVLTGPNDVWVLPGRLTAMIRGKWGLNDLLPDHNYSDAKNRKDHRHHAIDAMVAGLTDRRLLNEMSRAYDAERQRVVIPLPWDSLRDDLDARLRAMIVSHKPDHGLGGQLHEDTAYGTVKQPNKEGGNNLVYRKPLTTLNENEIGRIRDRRLRDMVQSYVERAKADGKKLAQALAEFGEQVGNPHIKHGVRHVRLLKTEDPAYLVPVRNETSGEVYKSYSAGNNAYIDIVEMADGKWQGEAVNVFQANQPGNRPAWRLSPGLRFVMRLHKGDLLRIERDGKIQIMIVRKLEASNNRIVAAAHNESGDLQRRHADPDDPFRWLIASYNSLKAMGAERVRADEAGTLWRIKPEEAIRSL